MNSCNFSTGEVGGRKIRSSKASQIILKVQYWTGPKKVSLQLKLKGEKDIFLNEDTEDFEKISYGVLLHGNKLWWVDNLPTAR